MSYQSEEDDSKELEPGAPIDESFLDEDDALMGTEEETYMMGAGEDSMEAAFGIREDI